MELPLDGPLDLEATLHSGQAFRWKPGSEGWQRGFIGNRPVRVRVAKRKLEWESPEPLAEAEVRRYFRLEGSHGEFLREVQRDPALEVALAAFPGLRLLSQDPWEVFVAYILSANSNVGKIERTIASLSAMAGQEVEWNHQRWHRFPSPEALAALSEQELRTTRMGYRAPHLRQAARLVADGTIDLGELARTSYEGAHEQMVEVPGIGDKVADCIQLYGLGHRQAFPTDVWIHRVVRESYFPRRRLNYGQLGEWARAHFGPWAGYAQHYLFHYRRVVGRLPRVASSHEARRRRPTVLRSNRLATRAGARGNRIPA